MSVTVGQRFRCLEVVSISEKRAKNGGKIANCLCDCGNTKEIVTQSLVNGSTKSCGCLKIRANAKRHRKKATIRSCYGVDSYAVDGDFDAGERNVGFI